MIDHGRWGCFAVLIFGLSLGLGAGHTKTLDFWPFLHRGHPPLGFGTYYARFITLTLTASYDSGTSGTYLLFTCAHVHIGAHVMKAIITLYIALREVGCTACPAMHRADTSASGTSGTLAPATLVLFFALFFIFDSNPFKKYLYSIRVFGIKTRKQKKATYLSRLFC